MLIARILFRFFFFNDTATTEIYTLSLHDALPISKMRWLDEVQELAGLGLGQLREEVRQRRSEEHTSELQSHSDLVCRLLLEKKKKQKRRQTNRTAQQQPYRQPPASAARNHRSLHL